MRISYNWIKSLVDIPLLPLELAELLTKHSFETTVTKEYGVPPGVKTVRITKIEKHPKADRLQLATITAGRNEITLVCGAPNIQIGQIVPYSPPGVELVDDEGKKFVVEAREIHGEMSEGMLNSLRELGLHHDHGGIWILADDTPVGRELSELVPRDTLLEADVTPNRAHDCLSHIGVAREVAALLRLPLSEPVSPDLPEPKSDVEGWTIDIEDSRLCPHYLAVVMDSLQLAPSPLWLQVRLLAAGGKPINNLVDATNYVTFEYGNPMHLFDRDKLPGKKIGARAATKGETLTTLDGIERHLTPEDIVITADDKVDDLAGIMGGAGSAVSENTTHGLLEVANFNPYHIQETSRRLGLRTEASARFSKGLDPNGVGPIAQRTLALLQETTPAHVVGVIDNYPKHLQGRTVSFDPARVSQVAGSDIFDDQKSKSILTHLRCVVDDKKTPWAVTVPTNRFDIEGEYDLIEEVIRVVGLDKIASDPPENMPLKQLSPAIYWREVVRDTMVELGLTETYNYSFESEAWAKLAGVGKVPHIAVTNPPAPELKNLRVGLLPGLLAHADKNRDMFQRNVERGETSLFEIGHVFKPALPAEALREGGRASRVPGVIESTHLAAVIVGSSPSLEYIAQKLAEALSIDPPLLKNIITPDMRSALKYHLPVVGFEVNLDELLLRVEKDVPILRSLEEVKAEPVVPTAFVPLPKYPSVFRDISMLVDPAITVEQAQEVIERAGGELVADVDLFDEYEPAPSTFAKASADAAEPRKSLAFHIEYSANDRTLTDEKINVKHGQIVQSLEQEIEAQIR